MKLGRVGRMGMKVERGREDGDEGRGQHTCAIH